MNTITCSVHFDAIQCENYIYKNIESVSGYNLFKIATFTQNVMKNICMAMIHNLSVSQMQTLLLKLYQCDSFVLAVFTFYYKLLNSILKTFCFGVDRPLHLEHGKYS